MLLNTPGCLPPPPQRMVSPNTTMCQGRKPGFGREELFSFSWEDPSWWMGVGPFGNLGPSHPPLGKTLLLGRDAVCTSRSGSGDPETQTLGDQAFTAG